MKPWEQQSAEYQFGVVDGAERMLLLLAAQSPLKKLASVIPEQLRNVRSMRQVLIEIQEVQMASNPFWPPIQSA